MAHSNKSNFVHTLCAWYARSLYSILHVSSVKCMNYIVQIFNINANFLPTCSVNNTSHIFSWTLLFPNIVDVSLTLLYCFSQDWQSLCFKESVILSYMLPFLDRIGYNTSVLFGASYYSFFSSSVLSSLFCTFKIITYIFF